MFEFAGLKSHPQYELAKRQMRGFSGMVTFYIKGGLEESSVFLKAVKVNKGHCIHYNEQICSLWARPFLKTNICYSQVLFLRKKIARSKRTRYEQNSGCTKLLLYIQEWALGPIISINVLNFVRFSHLRKVLVDMKAWQNTRKLY